MDDTEPLAIYCSNLVKRYLEVVAVNGLTLEVKKGECFGLLGPHGAGTTTAVEILAAVRDDDNLTPTERHQQLVKVNVRLQLTNLSHFPIVRDSAKPLRLHGWVYDLESGKIQVVTSG